VSLITGLDVVAKRKIPCICLAPNRGHPDHSLATVLTRLSSVRVITDMWREMFVNWICLLFNDADSSSDCIA
jgi:hypothetical protein